MKNMNYCVDVIVAVVILIMEIFGNILYYKMRDYIKIQYFKFLNV